MAPAANSAPVMDGLTAAARLRGTEVKLAAGEWVLIPALTRHGVRDAEAGTRWLAVHVHPAGTVAEG